MGKLENTPDRAPAGHIREPWLFLIAFAAQYAITKWFRGVSPSVVATVIAVSYGIILAGVIRNWRWWGIRLVAVGVVLNALVMMLNGGFMPVSPDTAVQAGLGQRVAQIPFGEYISGTKGVLLDASSTHVRWLSDTIAIQQIRRVVSPGDLVIFAGLFVFLAEVLGSRFVTKRNLQVEATEIP